MPELDLDPEERAAEAFHSSALHRFAGEDLEPLTFARDAAMARLDITLRTWADSLYLIYLCKTPADRVTRLRGEAEIARWYAEADAWAESIGASRASAIAEEANAVALRILQDRYASEFSVGNDGAEPQKKTQGQPMKRSSSRESAKPPTARSRRGK